MRNINKGKIISLLEKLAIISEIVESAAIVTLKILKDSRRL